MVARSTGGPDHSDLTVNWRKWRQFWSTTRST